MGDKAKETRMRTMSDKKSNGQKEHLVRLDETLIHSWQARSCDRCHLGWIRLLLVMKHSDLSLDLHRLNIVVDMHWETFHPTSFWHA